MNEQDTELEKLLQLVEAQVAAIRAELADEHERGVREHVSELDSLAARCTLLVTRW